MNRNCPHKPELLIPAGNLEKLRVAVLYGADAVYVGGQKYGLRARADNFTEHELAVAADFVHQRGAKLYVTLNANLHDQDFDGLDIYCRFLESIGIDAVIVSDAGVAAIVRANSNLRLHLSTQASCLNRHAAQIWKELGFQRIVVGRELTIEESSEIAKISGLEVEMFVHGAMCMAYSGNCTISNFTAGRDSNRGGCIQSCRFPYSVQLGDSKSAADLESSLPANYMSSQDLIGVKFIPKFFELGIHSLKIEGRMKSDLYVATVARTYRKLIDRYASGEWNSIIQDDALIELEKFSHRTYCSGSLDGPAGTDSVYHQEAEPAEARSRFLGIVLQRTDAYLVLRLHESLSEGDQIELLPFKGNPVTLFVQDMLDVSKTPLVIAKQESIVLVPLCPELEGIEASAVLRRSISVERQVA